MNTSKADILDPIDGDHIRNFAKSKKILLSSKDNKQIDDALKNNTTLKHLVDLVASFNHAFEAANQFPGLTNQEVDELKGILEQLKKLKANSLNKNTPTETLKEMVELEKKLVALDHTRQWWDINIDALNKETVWNSLIQLARTEIKKNEVMGDENNSKLTLLEHIKSEWDESQLFSKLSSENLLLFYTDFICELETCLLTLKKKKINYPLVIQAYLDDLLQALQKIKSTAVHAMAYRLNCTDYYQHIECDDLVTYTASKIQDASDITVLRLDKAPPMRHSLNTYLFKSYSTIIREHKLSMKNLNVNTAYKVPDDWTAYAADHPAFYPIIHNPIFIYFAHGFSINPETMPTEHIISPLERHRILLNHAKTEYHLLKCIHNLTEPNPIQTLIESESKKLNSTPITKSELGGYIQLLSHDIFNKYLEATTKQNNANYQTITDFYDVTMNIITDEIKLTLMSACKDQITQNPYWLTLINHLGENDTNNLLDSRPSTSIEFNKLLSLSKQYQALKVAVKANLENIIYKEITKSNHSFSLPLLKDAELIALWRAATKKLNSNEEYPHLYFITKLVNSISDEIILRTPKHPALLKDLASELSAHHHNLLWTPSTVITDKVRVAQLIAKIDKHRAASPKNTHDFALLLEQCHQVRNQKAHLSSIKPMLEATKAQPLNKPQEQVVQKLLFILDKDLLAKNDSFISLNSIKNIFALTHK